MELVGFLVILGIASWIQTNAGFAFGMLVIGVVSAINLMPISSAAFVVSVLSLVNVIAALRGGVTHVDKQALSWVLLFGVPGVFLGVMLLDYLAAQQHHILRQLLGGSILCCSLMLAVKGRKLHRSHPSQFMLGGALGGLLGGLFATFGPPVVYLYYRQPWPIQRIRNTLLATFTLSSITRIGIVLQQQTVTNDLWLYIYSGVPVVMLTTWLSKRFSLKVDARHSRFIGFAMLFGCGASLLLPA